MRAVGVREFRDQATALMGAGEALRIERRGEPIGYYVPIGAKDPKAGRKALKRLGSAVDDVLAASGLDEATMVDEVARGRRRL